MILFSTFLFLFANAASLLFASDTLSPWNWTLPTLKIPSRDHVGRFGMNDGGDGYPVSLPNANVAIFKKFHSVWLLPQGWPSSWGWEKSKADRWYPCLKPRISKSQPKNIFGTYSAYTLLRHQRFALCYIQNSWRYDQGGMSWEVLPDLQYKKWLYHKRISFSGTPAACKENLAPSGHMDN